jgi:hypothetical protein
MACLRNDMLLSTYLTAQLEVAHDHGNFGASQRQDDEYNKEEAKHVVKLVVPDGGENKVELDEDGTKWQNTAHQARSPWLHVPHLLGNLTRNLICANRVFGGLLGGNTTNARINRSVVGRA